MFTVLPVRRRRIHRAAAFLGATVKHYARRLILWRTRQALLALNDHMLRDIGLTRQEVELGRFPSCDN
jgi:uncharacterized protein YjiS (DUF1127 family)